MPSASTRDKLIAQQQLETTLRTLRTLRQRTFKLDNFVYQVSHDIRSPLCTTLGLVHLIKAEDDRQVISHYVDLIENRMYRLDHFVRKIQDHAQALHAEVEAKPVRVPDIVEACLSELQYLPHVEHLQCQVRINGSTLLSEYGAVSC